MADTQRSAGSGTSSTGTSGAVAEAPPTAFVLFGATGDLARRMVLPAFYQLAQHDLVLETANQNIALLEAAIRVNDKVPELRIVLDHLPAFDPSPENQAAYDAVLKEETPQT